MPIMPIDLTAIVAVVLGMLVILIPVAGLTARFAFKPIVEAIAQMRTGQGAQEQLAMLDQRMALMEQQLQMMETSMERLTEDRDFHRQLHAPSE